MNETKCGICGKDEASNYTWSQELICDSCVSWISESKLKNVLDEREKEREFADFWATFCHKENIDFRDYYSGLKIAQSDLDYYFRNSLWILVDTIQKHNAISAAAKNN